jgi:hypothetical protein
MFSVSKMAFSLPIYAFMLARAFPSFRQLHSEHSLEPLDFRGFPHIEHTLLKRQGSQIFTVKSLPYIISEPPHFQPHTHSSTTLRARASRILIKQPGTPQANPLLTKPGLKHQKPSISKPIHRKEPIQGV